MSDQQADPGPDVATLAIGILGGTGDQGRGLARRFAVAGNPVIIGSRSAERAAAAARTWARNPASAAWRTRTRRPPPTW